MNPGIFDGQLRVVPLNTIWQFHACDYTQKDAEHIGYRCVYCGHIYKRGRYGIECANLIICDEYFVRCGGCDALVPDPLLWVSRDELNAYVVQIHTRGGKARFLPMSREWPRRVYCGPGR